MNPSSAHRLFLTWLALLGLLALTVGTALLPLGSLNVPLNFAIAAIKALLVAAIFMEILRSTASVKLVAAAGFAWLALLLALSLADFLFRAAS